MSRLHAISLEAATGKAKELLDQVGEKFGMVPNMMRTMASSPVVLEAYLQFQGALGRGRLSAKTREQLALAVSEANACDYCLAAHSAVGKMVGLSVDQIADSRHGTAVDPKIDRLIQFARKVVDQRGRVSDDDVAELREAGFDDGAISEVVAGVALDIFTNYFNIVADTVIDFPKATPLDRSAAVSV